MSSSGRSKVRGMPMGEGGGQLLQELEALSQALYKSLPLQTPTKDPSFAGSNRPPPARDPKPSNFLGRLSQQLPSSPISQPKSPLSHARHSVSGFRSNTSSAVAADEERGSMNKGRSSLAFERHGSKEMSSFPEWLEDNIDFSQKLEAPIEKKSIWNWKPFRALAHMGQQRFNCAFSAYVHGVEGLPSRMNGMRLTVHFKHKDSSLHTLPSRVFHGSVEFEETLRHKCAVFGSRKPSQGIRYMSKSFTLTVVALDMDELELGKHRLDLSRLLPETVDEKSEEANANTWTTSFKLTGKGKGGGLLVTFGYEILDPDKESTQVGNTSARFGDSPAHRALRSFNSLPNSPHGILRSRPLDMPVSSPAASEPDSEFADHLGMDHLSLDGNFNQEYALHKTNLDHKVETLPQSGPRLDSFAASEVLLEGYSHTDSVLAPHTPGRSVESSDLSTMVCSQHSTELKDGGSEGDIHLTVEDHEVELSPLSGKLTSIFEKSDSHALTAEIGKLDAVIQGGNDPELDPADSEEAFFKGEWQLQEDTDVLSAAGMLSPEDDITNDSSVEMSESGLIIGKEMSDLKNSVGQNFLLQDENNRTNAKDEREERKLDPAVSIIVHNNIGTLIPADLRTDDSLATYVGKQIPPEEATLISPPAYMELEFEEKRKTPELLDDEAEVVTGEFLEMLQGVQGITVFSSDSESDSPRALLLKQFEEEALLESGFGLNSNVPKSSDFERSITPSKVDIAQVEKQGWQHDHSPALASEDHELAAIMDAAESELQKAAQTLRSKARAKMLEDAEAEALMQEWGLDERAFSSSPASSSNYYGSSSGKFNEVPPLAYGFGSMVPTGDGGELRSMSSAHFQSGYDGGELVMHVSKPVVVPAEMGSSALDILRRMAASGVENMAMQAMLSMPLEDITGKSVHQIAYEGQSAIELIGQRYGPLGPGKDVNRVDIDLAGQNTEGGYLSDSHQGSLTNANRSSIESKSIGRRRRAGDEDIVSLDDLAPVAMERIEALALEGLKIQSDMTEEEAPYNMDAMPWNEANPFGKRKSRNDSLNLLEGVAATALLEGSSSTHGEVGDGVMSMAISLEEWMRLDAGVYDEAETSENTLAILAAHNTNHKNLGGVVGEQGLVQSKSSKPASPSGGAMGNTLTLAMLVQLRDPLRNYEPVGAPMMALVQAERILVPPRPKLWKRVSMKGNNEVDEDQNKNEQQPQFKITGVHISGLKLTEDNKKDNKEMWGNQKQLQSGSRWLLAHGMAKAAKPALLKSKPTPPTTKTKPTESLWSISSRIQGNSKKWSSSSSRSSIVRNPDVNFSKSSAKKR